MKFFSVFFSVTLMSLAACGKGSGSSTLEQNSSASAINLSAGSVLTLKNTVAINANSTSATIFGPEGRESQPIFERVGKHVILMYPPVGNDRVLEKGSELTVMKSSSLPSAAYNGTYAMFEISSKDGFTAQVIAYSMVDDNFKVVPLTISELAELVDLQQAPTQVIR